MEELVIESFKIIPDAMAYFKALTKKHSSIRFTESPIVNKEYISLFFTIKNEEYYSLINDCIDKRIYYYVA